MAAPMPERYQPPPQAVVQQLAPIGEVTLTVIEATDLAGSQTFTRMNPYCVILVGDQKYFSQIDRGGGRTPKWNEKFVFDVYPGQKSFRIAVYDKVNFGDDQYIGYVDFPFASLYDQQPHDDWFKIVPGSVRGTQPGNNGGLHVSVHFLHDNTSRTVLVTNIPNHVLEQQIGALFSSAGSIVAIHITPGGAVKYALVEFSTRAAKVAALRLDGAELGGARIHVEPARISIPQQITFEQTGKTPADIERERQKEKEEEKKKKKGGIVSDANMVIDKGLKTVNKFFNAITK